MPEYRAARRMAENGKTAAEMPLMPVGAIFRRHPPRGRPVASSKDGDISGSSLRTALVSMRLILLTFSFFPETTALAKRATETARYLRKKGWEVTVITHAPNYPQGVVYQGYGERSVDRRTEEGVDVIRLRPWLVSLTNLPMRLAAESWFSLRSLWRTLRVDGDIILATSPYMFLGPAGRIAGWLSHRPFVWEVRDLTWRYASAAGKRTFGMDRVFEALMLWTGKRADAMVTTTAGQLAYFADLARAPKRTQVVPNGVSQGHVDRVERLRTTPPAGGEKRVVYAGLLGFAQGLATIVESASLVPEAEFYLVGDGAQREGLERMAREQHIPNVHFVGYVGAEEVIGYYQSASVLVAHLRSDPVFEVTQPSKIWEYMVNGRPVVYGGAGEAARAVAASGGGLVVPPDDPGAMARAIRQLLNNPEEAASMGEKGRAYVLSYKRREQILDEFDTFLRSLLPTR